jgi:hypothetical protein
MKARRENSSGSIWNKDRRKEQVAYFNPERATDEK